MNPPGALAAWREAKRNNPLRTFDALQEAAGWEQAGHDALAAGLPGDADFAEHCFTRTREIMTAHKLVVTAEPLSMAIPRARRRRVSAGLEGLA
jgi:hypothetical protein